MRRDAAGTETHYRDLWLAITPGVTEADLFTLGETPLDVLLLGRPGGYSTADVQRLRQSLITACLLGSPASTTDVYRGKNGAYGHAGEFCLAAHGVAVIVRFGRLSNAQSDTVIAALQG